MASFERVGRIMMAWTMKSDKSPDWRDATDCKTSDEWFDSLLEFISSEVKIVFGQHAPPTVEQICSLPFHPSSPGVYAGILTPLFLHHGHPTYVYPGCALRPVKERTSEHESPKSLAENPENKFYQLLHGTSDFSHKFVSLAKIPIDGRLEKAEISRRRLLCRIAETFFTVWLMAADPSRKQTRDLTACSQKSFTEAYGISAGDFGGWQGLATHSPMKEQTGLNDYKVVAKSRYEAGLDGFAKYYDGRENIPADIEALVKSRSAVDTVRRAQRKDERKRKLSAEELAAERDHQKQQKKARKDAMSPVEAEEFAEANSSYHAAWSANKKAQMTEQDEVDAKADSAARTRKYKVNKAFNEGKMTQEEYDDAAANNWVRKRGRLEKSTSVRRLKEAGQSHDHLPEFVRARDRRVREAKEAGKK